jgi:hypothetical protein
VVALAGRMLEQRSIITLTTPLFPAKIAKMAREGFAPDCVIRHAVSDLMHSPGMTGIIGTGATAVQAIPVIAQQAKASDRVPTDAQLLRAGAQWQGGPRGGERPQGRLRRDPRAHPQLALRL